MVGSFVNFARVTCVHGWAIRHCCPGELYYSWLSYSPLLSELILFTRELFVSGIF